MAKKRSTKNTAYLLIGSTSCSLKNELDYIIHHPNLFGYSLAIFVIF